MTAGGIRALIKFSCGTISEGGHFFPEVAAKRLKVQTNDSRCLNSMVSWLNLHLDSEDSIFK
jgi:hypothetical protein